MPETSLTEMALAALYGASDATPLTNAEFNRIVDRWKLSNNFLCEYLQKSYDSIRNYRYRDRELPADASKRMRRLERFLTAST